jgi:predicted DNA-binding transcriptional regulator AlpA
MSDRNPTMLRCDIRAEYPGTPQSRSGFNRWSDKYDFPKPTYLNPNTPVWVRDAVKKWFDSRPTTHADALALSRGET